MVNLVINDVERAFDGDDETPLLWYLQRRARASRAPSSAAASRPAAPARCTSTAPRPSPASRRWARSRAPQVTTIEGLSEEGDHPVQVAWRELNVAQCGYCQAGQIMRAAALVDQCQAVTDEDIDAVMSANICRCGTYPRIRAAIKQAAEAK